MLTAAGDDGLVKPVVRVLLDGIQDTLGLQRYFSACPVAWQNRDAMVTHALSHIALLHERDPRSLKNMEASDLWVSAIPKAVLISRKTTPCTEGRGDVS